EHVVDAPADVLGPDTKALAPPGVVLTPRLEGAEGVDVAHGEQAIEVFALLEQEAAGVLVLLGPGEVDLAVGRVEVAHDEDRLPGARPRGEGLEDGLIESTLEGDAAVVALLPVAVGEVDVGNGQRAEAGDLHAAFGVHRRVAEGRHDLVGGYSAEEPDPAVAGARGGREVAVQVARHPER